MRSSSFLVLFVLFILTLEFRELNTINVFEILFMIYALGESKRRFLCCQSHRFSLLGFALEKLAAMQEHGVSVYFTGTWVTSFLTYLWCSADLCGLQEWI